jgi:hypothetical protein
VGRISSRWLIFVPVALFAIYAQPADAEPIQGLDTTYYTIDEIPPVQSTTQYPVCGTELENNINRSYDGETYENCTDDLFMVHMQGYITIPEHTTIEFFLASDDGGQITIGNTTFGVWQDQGCSATMSGELQLQAGPLPLELWMYENGGGSCVMLAWKIDDEDWQIVPEEAFTTNGDVSTTTVAVSTTVESTTTSSVQTSTSLAPEPTMPEPSTTTTTTTTSTVVETTTTTEPVSPPPAQPPATVEQPPTTEPAPPDTEPSPPETEPVEETLPLDPPDTEPEAPETTDLPPDTLPFVEDTEPAPPDTEPAPPDTLPDAPEAPLSDEELETILDTIETVEALTEALEELTSEQAEQLIEAILEDEPTQEQATAIASSPAALAVLTPSQATQVFQALDVTELDNTQLEALAEAVSDAPTEIKEAFEDSVDIFSDGLGTYVPVDSKIPVSERVTLIAIAAGATLTAASSRMRR